MKPLALLMLCLLVGCGQAKATRAWNHLECKNFAITAGAVAELRDEGVPLELVIAKVDPDAMRLPGDLEYVQQLARLVYNSSYDADITYGLVYAACDRGGLSRFVREV